MKNEKDKKLEREGERTVILQDESLRKLKGFVQIPKVILMHQRLSYGAKMAYSVLLSYAWQDDFCYPAQEAIAKDLGCKARQVRNLLTELKNEKLISWKQQGLNRPNIYYILPLKTEEIEPDRQNIATPDRQNMSGQDRQNIADKVYINKEYTKPLTVRNGDNKKSHVRKLRNLGQPAEQTAYLADEIVTRLGDKHSIGFYRLVAAKIPENVIRQALSEIRADGANNPPKVFTYRMEKYAEKELGLI